MKCVILETNFNILFIDVDSQGQIYYNSESSTTTGSTAIASNEFDFNVISSESDYQLPPPPPPPSKETGIYSSHSNEQTEPHNKILPSISSEYQPTHFFAPIKTKDTTTAGIVARSVNFVETDRLRPDFHVSNVLATAPTSGAIRKQPAAASKAEPIYAEINKKNKCGSPSTFQVWQYQGYSLPGLWSPSFSRVFQGGR